MIESLIEERYGTQVLKENVDTTNKTLELILDHVSCRSFDSEPIPTSLIELLFATAFSAPSKSDLQQASVVRVTDRSKLHRIAGLGKEIHWIDQAPEFMVWCGDNRRIRKISTWRGHNFANDHLDSFMNAAVDAGIVMQTFIIAAESVGLKCCPISQIRDYVDPVSDELGLPTHVFPVAGLCVGWPDQTPKKSMRLPLNVTVHHDRYEDSALLDEVEQYDKRRELAEPTPTEKQRLIEEYGVAENYGWSENHARQYSIPMRTDFGRYIRKQGFNLS